jgi:hypothetical protein
MKDIKVFMRFLKLAQRYFENERGIAFYAGKLGITPDELSRIIWDTSDCTLPEWLDVMEKIYVEKHGRQIV